MERLRPTPHDPLHGTHEAHEIDGGADGFDTAYDRALRFLAHRPRSCQEVRRRLTMRGVSTQVVERVISRLVQSGLVDDRAFAVYWVANRAQFSPRGRHGLHQELAQKGIDREIIKSVLDGLSDETGQAVAAGRQRLRAMSLHPDVEFSRRMVAFLARRGFTYSDAIDAAELLLTERRKGQNIP